LKYLTHTEMQSLSVTPVSKTKIRNLATTSFGALIAADHTDLHQWLLRIGIAEADVEGIVHELNRPEFGVNNLKTLFAIDAEDIDDILKNLPLGKRKLIKKSMAMEK